MTSGSFAERSALLWIRHVVTECGYPPTTRELADHLGMSVGGTHALLERLREKGLLTKEPGKVRTLRVTG